MKFTPASMTAAIALLASSHAFSLATQDDVIRWPYGVVAYEFATVSAMSTYRPMYEKAIQHWESVSGIRFVDVTTLSPQEREKYPIYVRLTTVSTTGCGSQLGYFGNGNPPYFKDDGSLKRPSSYVYRVSLMVGCTEETMIPKMAVPASLRNIGITAAHEIGHVLGFIHEHQRKDRDNYLFVNDRSFNYTKRTNSIEISSNFDYLSLMHYYPWQGGAIPAGDIPQNYPQPWTRVPQPYNLSFDPPTNPSAADIAKANRLRYEFPQYESRLHYRSDFSESDIAGVAAFYASDISDVAVDSFKGLSFCSPSAYTAGTCNTLRQLTARSDTANYGPWNSGQVTVTHVFPAGSNLNSLAVSVTNTDADSCETKNISYCPTGTCETRAALVCYKSSSKPMELIRTEFSLIHPSTSGQPYNVLVSTNGSRDDMPKNNTKSVTLGKP